MTVCFQPALLEKESGIELREIYPIVLRLLESFKESPKKEHKAVYERYKVLLGVMVTWLKRSEMSEWNYDMSHLPGVED